MESTASRLTGVESELDMIPFIWQRLPADILETVLTKLPLSVLRKFSGVSKSWKAFIHSEVFAHRCQSSEPTVFHFSGYVVKPFISVPNLKTDSWEKIFLEFIIPEDEAVELIGTSEGLLCYRVYKKTKFRDKPLPYIEIFLVIHNPFTRKWRRFVVPYTFKTLNGMVGGLAVDQDTGSYKVVLAFIEEHSPRVTFIYDSGANSWSVSTALPPALTKRTTTAYLTVSSSICRGGELYWFVEELEGFYTSRGKTLIMYTIELDTWFTATQHDSLDSMPDYLQLTSFQKRPVIVYLLEGRSDVFREEFACSGWNLTRFDSQDVIRLLQAADHEDVSSKLEQKRSLALGEEFYKLESALAEGETWFIFYRDIGRNLVCLKLEAGSVTQWPDGERVYIHHDMRSLCTFAARLNAFV